MINNMKRIILDFIIVLATIPVIAQNTLTVHQKDGQQFCYGFEEKPVLIFSDTVLVIQSTKVEVQYELAKIAKFTFDDIEDAVIGIKVDDTKASISLDENTVSIFGVKADTKVCLFIADGKLLSSYTANQEGCVSFSIAELPDGMYIISSESLSVTILKK